MCWHTADVPADAIRQNQLLAERHGEIRLLTEPDSEEPMEWIEVLDPPRHVPVPVLLSPGSQDRDAGQPENGSLVMYHWITDGKTISKEIDPPLSWPQPQSITGNTVVIDLGTSVAPIEVEARVFRSVDERGLPETPSPAIWCRYLSSSRECSITRNSDEETWKIVLALPGRDTFYISLRAM
jgi:hypothetical protein